MSLKGASPPMVSAMSFAVNLPRSCRRPPDSNRPYATLIDAIILCSSRNSNCLFNHFSTAYPPTTEREEPAKFACDEVVRLPERNKRTAREAEEEYSRRNAVLRKRLVVCLEPPSRGAECRSPVHARDLPREIRAEMSSKPSFKVQLLPRVVHAKVA